jgi:hypothetical protein
MEASELCDRDKSRVKLAEKRLRDTRERKMRVT